MPFSLACRDISRMTADCIVVAANPDLHITGGVGLAVARRAGFGQLQAACQKVAPVPCGGCALTPAFGLEACHVAHVVGPVWHGGSMGEDVVLARAYAAALNAAWDAGDRSVAMPLISTGSYGFPVRWAFDIAVREIDRFLEQHDDMDVTLVLWGADARATGRERFPELASFIENTLEESDHKAKRSARRPWPGEGERFAAAGPAPDEDAQDQDQDEADEGVSAWAPYSASPEPRPAPEESRRAPGRPTSRMRPLPSLEAMLKRRDKSFSETIIDLIDERGLKDSQVYRAANISRQLFSKIRSNPSYRPTKKIALALAVALRLSLDETRDLLARAGLALSHASVFDIIVEYHIANEAYDIRAINEALYSYDQELLGSSAA